MPPPRSSPGSASGQNPSYGSQTIKADETQSLYHRHTALERSRTLWKVCHYNWREIDILHEMMELSRPAIRGTGDDVNMVHKTTWIGEYHMCLSSLK